MTTQGGGQKRPTTLLFVGVVILACMISAIAYVFLVVSERTKADKFKTQTAAIHEQVSLATDYLHRHDLSRQQTKQSVEDDALELKRRIPYGPVDLNVGSYVDQAAQQANILDVKWSVVGGLKVPKSGLEDKRTQEQRLLVNPATLKRTVIVVEFHARYREVLQLLKSLTVAPWMMEVTSVSFRRELAKDNGRDTGKEAGPKLAVKMEMRYSFE